MFDLFLHIFFRNDFKQFVPLLVAVDDERICRQVPIRSQNRQLFSLDPIQDDRRGQRFIAIFVFPLIAHPIVSFIHLFFLIGRLILDIPKCLHNVPPVTPAAVLVAH